MAANNCRLMAFSLFARKSRWVSLDRVSDLGVVDVSVGDIKTARAFGCWIEDHVHFMPLIRPLDLAQSHSLPSGMGVESISCTMSRPSRRVWRSS